VLPLTLVLEPHKARIKKALSFSLFGRASLAGYGISNVSLRYQPAELGTWPVGVNDLGCKWPRPSARRRCHIWKQPIDLDAVGSATANFTGVLLHFISHSKQSSDKAEVPLADRASATFASPVQLLHLGSRWISANPTLVQRPQPPKWQRFGFGPIALPPTCLRRDMARPSANGAKTCSVVQDYFVGGFAGALRVVGGGWRKPVTL